MTLKGLFLCFLFRHQMSVFVVMYLGSSLLKIVFVPCARELRERVFLHLYLIYISFFTFYLHISEFFCTFARKIMQERKHDMNIDELTSKAHYVHISIPYNPEDNLITFDDGVMTELECDENFVPPMLNAKNMRLEMAIDIKEGRMEEWTSDNGYLRMQAKVRDGGTYTLLDADKNPIWQINGYVPNRLIPSFEIEGDYGDYIELRINADGSISNWKKEIDLSVFIKEGHAPKPIKTNKWHKAENALWYIRSKNLNAEEINWLSKQLRKL